MINLVIDCIRRLRHAGDSSRGSECFRAQTAAITARAASHLEEWTKWFATQQGPGFVPVIMWAVTHSSNPHFVPELTLGFERRDVVDRSRAMECEGKEVEIYQYAPDELFGTNGQKFVDLRDNKLVIVDEEEGAAS